MTYVCLNILELVFENNKRVLLALSSRKMFDEYRRVVYRGVVKYLNRVNANLTVPISGNELVARCKLVLMHEVLFKKSDSSLVKYGIPRDVIEVMLMDCLVWHDKRYPIVGEFETALYINICQECGIAFETSDEGRIWCNDCMRGE